MKNRISYFNNCYFDFERIEAEIQRQANEHLESVFSGAADGSYVELTTIKKRAVVRIEFSGNSEQVIDLEKLLDEEIRYASKRDHSADEMDVTLQALKRLSAKLERAIKRLR